MDWIFQDWEHEYLKDEIYAAEKQNEFYHEWYEWEEKNRKPATIKSVIVYENKSRKLRRINKKRV